MLKALGTLELGALRAKQRHFYVEKLPRYKVIYWDNWLNRTADIINCITEIFCLMFIYLNKAVSTDSGRNVWLPAQPVGSSCPLQRHGLVRTSSMPVTGCSHLVYWPYPHCISSYFFALPESRNISTLNLSRICFAVACWTYSLELQSAAECSDSVSLWAAAPQSQGVVGKWSLFVSIQLSCNQTAGTLITDCLSGRETQIVTYL